MSLWWLLLIIGIAGALGGVVNALISDNGFILPKPEQIDGLTIYRPGYLGNVIIGAIAAVISWGLYGPFAAYYLIGCCNNPSTPMGLTLSSFVGGILVGVGGARWLTNEVDKNLLQVAASKAAGAQPDPGASQRMALASPAQALNIARNMK